MSTRLSLSSMRCSRGFAASRPSTRAEADGAVVVAEGERLLRERFAAVRAKRADRARRPLRMSRARCRRAHGRKAHRAPVEPAGPKNAQQKGPVDSRLGRLACECRREAPAWRRLAGGVGSSSGRCSQTVAKKPSASASGSRYAACVCLSTTGRTTGATVRVRRRPGRAAGGPPAFSLPPSGSGGGGVPSPGSPPSPELSPPPGFWPPSPSPGFWPPSPSPGFWLSPSPGFWPPSAVPAAGGLAAVPAGVLASGRLGLHPRRAVPRSAGASPAPLSSPPLPLSSSAAAALRASSAATSLPLPSIARPRRRRRPPRKRRRRRTAWRTRGSWRAVACSIVSACARHPGSSRSGPREYLGVQRLGRRQLVAPERPERPAGQSEQDERRSLASASSCVALAWCSRSRAPRPPLRRGTSFQIHPRNVSAVVLGLSGSGASATFPERVNWPRNPPPGILGGLQVPDGATSQRRSGSAE